MSEKQTSYDEKHCYIADCSSQISNITYNSIELGQGLTCFPNNFNEQEMEDVQLNNSRKNSITLEAKYQSDVKVAYEVVTKSTANFDKVTSNLIKVTYTEPSDEVSFFFFN